MSKENIIVTGKTPDEIIRSSNSVIQTLLTRINKLEAKLNNISGDSNKVEKNVVRVVTNKNNTFIQAVTNDGTYQIQLTRKE